MKTEYQTLSSDKDMKFR